MKTVSEISVLHLKNHDVIWLEGKWAEVTHEPGETTIDNFTVWFEVRYYDGPTGDWVRYADQSAMFLRLV